MWRERRTRTGEMAMPAIGKKWPWPCGETAERSRSNNPPTAKSASKFKCRNELLLVGGLKSTGEHDDVFCAALGMCARIPSNVT